MDDDKKQLIQQVGDAINDPFAVQRAEEEEELKIIMLDSITAKQQEFCLQYVQSFNAAKAAADAGYSIQSAASIGYALLRKPEIQAYIEALRQIRADKYRHSVIDELAQLYQATKRGEIKYDLVVQDGSDTKIAMPIMQMNEDGSMSVHREKPDYKLALEALKTLAEYTIPKPTNPTNPTDQQNQQNKLAVANKYIQNNTIKINNPTNSTSHNPQMDAILNHISAVTTPTTNNPNNPTNPSNPSNQQQ